MNSKIKNILLRLRNLRQSALETTGEYSIENLAYKHLRNSGHLIKLKKILQDSTYDQLSVKPLNELKDVTRSLVMHVTKKKSLDDSGWRNIIQQTGGIEDSEGQWKHPGRCTMIPGNQITMRDVPHHVLGIDDLGTMKMMLPNQNYTYPGNKVFEIPLTPQWKTMIIQLINKIRNGAKYAK